MKRFRLSAAMRSAVAVAIGGSAFQFGGCNLGIGQVLNNFNPCGTVLDCDPRLYQFSTSGIDEPGEGLDIDPFCTFPPFCDASQDPIFGGLAENP